jgi:hypothetical protein
MASSPGYALQAIGRLLRLLAVRHARVIQAPGNDARSVDARDRLLRTVERTQDCLLD